MTLLLRTFLICNLFPFFVVAQPAADNLRKAISTEKDPGKKARAIIELCEQLRFSNPDSLRIESVNLHKLGDQQKQPVWNAYADFYQAIFYNLTGNPDSAIVIAENNIRLIRELNGEQVLLTKMYALAGNSLMRLNRQKDALQMFYASMQNAEAGRDKDGQFKALNNIGWAYMELEQFEKAIENFKQALFVIRENNLPDRYGTIYNNLASCYGSIGQVDSVYKYGNKGIEIATRYHDFAAMANGYSIIGTFLAKESKHQQALDHFKKALAIREKSNDPFFIVSDMAEIAELNAHIGNTGEGISQGLKALDIAQKNKIEAKLPMILTALAHNYEKAGRFQEAAETYKKLNALKDSLYKDANPRALAEIQTRYETEKKERKIEQQHNRIRLQNFLFVGVAGLILLAGLLIHSQYRRYKLRQETKMKTELMKQQEIAVKAVIEAEEQERQRIARDLHDGVGQMMSAAKMNLSAFESSAHIDQGEQKRSLDKIIGLVDESCRELRTVSHIMMPGVLLKHDLAAAIRDFTDKLDTKKLKVHLHTDGIDKGIDSNTETVLYRVLQECVNNVVRHADASTLDISLIRDQDGIHATVEDNGKGFDASDKLKYEGIGLKNIVTRMEYLKGTVDFDSAPGRGTVVALYVPYT
jgi:two-component system, NarL family, sensor kinase